MKTNFGAIDQIEMDSLIFIRLQKRIFIAEINNIGF